MSRSYLLAKEDERRAVEGMSARQRRLYENDKKIMKANNRKALPGPFRSDSSVFTGQFNPAPNEQLQRNRIKSMLVAIPRNRLEEESEAKKGAFLQAMTYKKVPPYLIKKIGDNLTGKIHHSFAAKHKRKKSKRKKSKKKISRRKISKKKNI